VTSPRAAGSKRGARRTPANTSITEPVDPVVADPAPTSGGGGAGELAATGVVGPPPLNVPDVDDDRPLLSNAERVEQQIDLRAALDLVGDKLDTREQIIQTAIGAAGSNAPFGPDTGEYRADLAGVIADWALAALDTLAARTAVTVVVTAPEAVNLEGSELYNGKLLNDLAAAQRQAPR
jgi:hypothetical protein